MIGLNETMQGEWKDKSLMYRLDEIKRIHNAWDYQYPFTEDYTVCGECGEEDCECGGGYE